MDWHAQEILEVITDAAAAHLEAATDGDAKWKQQQRQNNPDLK